MKIKEGFVIRRVMGSYVVVAIGEASQSFHGMVKLNETAAEIWENIAAGKTVDEMIAAMLEKYEVDGEKLREDVESTIKTFDEQGFIEA